MLRSAKDIQLIELKDTIAKLNELISAQTRSMDALQKTIEDLRQELSNKQAEVDYLKAKLFGSYKVILIYIERIYLYVIV